MWKIKIPATQEIRNCKVASLMGKTKRFGQLKLIEIFKKELTIFKR